MHRINTDRSRWITGGLAGAIALAMILTSAPEVEATSKMNPQRPYTSGWGVRGWTYRNNSCGAAVCAYESVSLVRSSWNGWRYVKDSKSYNVRSGSKAYSRRACRSGTYTYRTVHKQLVSFVGSGGLRIQGNGINFSYLSSKWVKFTSPRALRVYRNSRYCENGYHRWYR